MTAPNANMTEVRIASQCAPGVERVRYRCGGCGELFSLHGVRAHQSGRFVTAACRPFK